MEDDEKPQNIDKKGYQNPSESEDEVGTVEYDLSRLVEEITFACEHIHLYTLKDVQRFSIRLNQLEVRNDGRDMGINDIIDSAHEELQFIVDSVTNDSILYLAIGDGINEPEDVSSFSEDENDEAQGEARKD